MEYAKYFHQWALCHLTLIYLNDHDNNIIEHKIMYYKNTQILFQLRVKNSYSIRPSPSGMGYIVVKIMLFLATDTGS